MNDPAVKNSWSKSRVPSPPVRPVPTPPSQRPPSSKVVKEFRIVTGIFVSVLVAIVAVYVGALMTQPHFVAPVRASAPKLNGFSLLKAATDKPVRKEDVEDALAISPKKKWTLSEKRKLVAANRAGIIATRHALTFPYLEENRATSMDDEFPYYAKFRYMARVLTLAGHVAWEEGKQNEAADYYMDALTIGRRVPNRTSMIGRLVGIACESISRRAIWNRLESMDAPTAEHSLTRLKALQSECLPYYVTLEEEKYTGLHMAMEGMNNPDVLITGSREGGDEAEEDQKVRRVFRVYRTVVPRKYVADTLGAHMDKLILQSKKPYIHGNEKLPVPKELYTAIIVPAVQNPRLKYVYNETGDALLRTALALHLYKARNGSYPADLSELVTVKLLPSVPDDPFGLPGAPLRYRRLSTSKYILYSIGPDGTDDGGKGIEITKTDQKSDRTVKLDSMGDMVAGWYGY